MRGNPAFLGVALGGVIGLTATCLGAPIYRWQVVIWLVVVIVTALCGLTRSREGGA